MVKLVRWPSGTGTAEEYLAGTVAIGDGDSRRDIAGTVAIGDQNSDGVCSWDSAEGLGQQTGVLWLYRRRMLRLCELTWKGSKSDDCGFHLDT